MWFSQVIMEYEELDTNEGPRDRSSDTSSHHLLCEVSTPWQVTENNCQDGHHKFRMKINQSNVQETTWLLFGDLKNNNNKRNEFPEINFPKNLKNSVSHPLLLTVLNCLTFPVYFLLHKVPICLSPIIKLRNKAWLPHLFPLPFRLKKQQIIL